MGNARATAGEATAGGATSDGGAARGTSLAVLAALAALASSFALALPTPETTALSGSSHEDWSGVLERRTLSDGSVLSAYTARTPALDTSDVLLHVGFVPRFGCSPLLGIRFGGDMAPIAEAFFADGGRLSLEIDGREQDWPLLVDADGVQTTLWYDGEAGRRTALRQRLDDASRVTLALPNTVPISFSLLGSRKSTTTAERSCRANEPQPWNG